MAITFVFVLRTVAFGASPHPLFFSSCDNLTLHVAKFYTFLVIVQYSSLFFPETKIQLVVVRAINLKMKI